VAVGRGQALEERHPPLLAIAPAREADGAARLVDQQRVARELADVLIDERETTDGVAAEERAHRLHVLTLAARRAADRLARALDGGLRRRGVAADGREQGHARVGDGEPVVCLQRGGEVLLAAGAVGEQRVHAGLEAVGGGARRGGDRQLVAVGDGRHGRFSLILPEKGMRRECWPGVPLSRPPPTARPAHAAGRSATDVGSAAARATAALVIGSAVKRTPIASAIAFAMTAPPATTGGSPTP